MRGRPPSRPGSGKPGSDKPGTGRSGSGRSGSGKSGPARGGKPDSAARPGAAAAKAGAPGRARGGPKAATARKADGAKPPFKPRVKSAVKPAAKPAPAQTAAPAKSTALKGVSLDVRQYRVAADDDGIRLDRWFQRHLPDVGFNIVSRWSRTGQLRVDGARAAPGDRVLEGQTIRVPPAEARAPVADKPKRVRVIDLTPDEISF